MKGGGASAYGPYRHDDDMIGADRSWGGREGLVQRGGAPHGDFRGA